MLMGSEGKWKKTFERKGEKGWDRRKIEGQCLRMGDGDKEIWRRTR